MRCFRLLALCAMLCAILLPASVQADDAPDIGLKVPLKVSVVADGLMNPSGISFHPDGTLTICDSGNGRVVLVKDGKVEDYITGFKTEYWKTDAETGRQRFKLGPLSAIWINKDVLAVTNGGAADGEETVLFFDGPGTADSGKPTNSVGPTTDDEADKGEGNLTGMSLSADGSTIYVAGQGADAGTWVLSVDVASKKLTPLLSADKAGIEVNSPMATLPHADGTVLVLYSGKGGADDGLIVQWDPKAQKVVQQWNLPGLTDPMGMARLGAGNQVVVVDNNWSLTEVKSGRMALVDLDQTFNGNADVMMLADNLRGPVSCALSPDGVVHVAQLGDEFDAGKGQVLKIARP